jgi:folate-binding protein YgfZ
MQPSILDRTATDLSNASAGANAALSGQAALGHFGVIRVAGADGASFLQGQLTQDVLQMRDDQARLAAFCNAKGRMQASFVLFRRSAEEILLLCSLDILPATLKRLSMFVLRAKAKLSDATAEFVVHGLSGDAAEAAAAAGGLSALIPWAKADLGPASLVTLYPADGVPLALWCAPVGTPAPDGTALAAGHWHWLTVRSGIAMITQPIFEALVPQMLNYESVGGVSFKKGCYPGQEIVARSQFRGTLKRRAYRVHSGGELAVGQEVFEASDAEQPCGLVAAAEPSPAGGFDAIVSMQVAAAQAGAGLTAGSAGGPALELLPLPYPLLEDI